MIQKKVQNQNIRALKKKNNAEENGVHNINYKKPLEDQSLYPPIEINKTKKNNLYGEFDNSRPPLRDYN